MVSEAAAALFAGIISGWIVAITHPIITPLAEKLHTGLGVPKVISYLPLYLIWLVIMMGFAVYVYK